jgi:hypothetical protein
MSWLRRVCSIRPPPATDGWQLEHYRWSDELWDDEHGVEVGALDGLLERMLHGI